MVSNIAASGNCEGCGDGNDDSYHLVGLEGEGDVDSSGQLSTTVKDGQNSPSLKRKRTAQSASPEGKRKGAE
jgi:hypothetical protein